MARTRTTKNIAQRVDFSYLNRPQPMRRARLLLSIGACLAAVAWIGLSSIRVSGGKLQAMDRIHNPGPVSVAHAIFQNDCTKCHSGTSGNKFQRAVSDTACLTCHDGAIHQMNQRMVANPKETSRDAKILAVIETSDGKVRRSADCAGCHVEHRGKVALAATSDAHCVVCHADLASATQSGSTSMRNSIFAFNLQDHPSFGRRISSGGTPLDATPLKFNHKVHLETNAKSKFKERGCALCHQPAADRRYMQPISYAKNCAECHKLTLTPEITLAHADMSIVRSQLLGVPLFFQNILRTMTPEQRQKELTDEVKGTRGRKPTTRAIDESQWLAKKLGPLLKEIESSLEDSKAPKIESPTTQMAGAEVPTLEAMEYFVAFGASQQCAKCHEMNRSGRLATVPTKITSSPRRWYSASKFNHDAHRDMTCFDCHSKAWTSEPTSDFLSPDINSKVADGKSCVDCHRPSTYFSPAAPADCVTCHAFHDRAHERPPKSSIREGEAPAEPRLAR